VPPASPLGTPEPIDCYRMRVALALGDTILRDIVVAKDSTLTVGESSEADLVLPCPGDNRATGKLPLLRGTILELLPGYEGRLHIGDHPQTVKQLRASGADRVSFGPEDWGVLFPIHAPGVRIVIQCVTTPELKLSRMPWWRDPFYAILTVIAVATVLFHFAALLSYEAHRDEIESAEPSDRMARVMFNTPVNEEKDEDAKVPADSKLSETKGRVSRRSSRSEGKFGRTDKHQRSSAPRNDAHARTANLAMVGALNETRESALMQDLLGVGDALSATGGTGDVLVVGAGDGGMGLAGTGGGGGGTSEGSIQGSGDLNMGGAGSATRRKRNNARPRAPKEKTPTVKTGIARIKGQLSKALIDKEVRRHKAQIKFCYNKQLQRMPKLAGKVVLSWIIKMDGSVIKPKVKTSSLGSSDAESCMLRSLKGWKFPKPSGGVVQVDYPFMFGAH